MLLRSKQAHWTEIMTPKFPHRLWLLALQVTLEMGGESNSRKRAKNSDMEESELSTKRFKLTTSRISLKNLDEAATKLQKAYKSYRTRRNLADCAVVAEELWWKELDFVALRWSSISFFNSDRSETAVSRWARAKTRVAKLGKGLSKDKKAQEMALRHWLEVIDPRHRYGHNLRLYYDVWFESESSQPFFYWLDVGEGKEVSVEKFPRSDLQRQCIKYLGPKEREEYEMVVEDGKLVYKQSRMAVDTAEGTKWIYIFSASRKMYVGQKVKGLFQHSSFLAGGAAISAGRLVAHNGILEAIWSYSGHYRPAEESFTEFISFLEEHVDLTNVKKFPTDDDIPPGKSRDEKKRKLKSLTTTTDPKSPSPINKADENTPNVDNPATTEKNSKQENNTQNNNIEENLEAAMAELSRKPPCKWTTGTGPRISCVREYPAELQLQALEHVNLSPIVKWGNGSFHGPIPSPRPSPRIHLSPTVSRMGVTSPRVHFSKAS